MTLFKKNAIKSRIAAKADRLIEQLIVSPNEINESDLKELDLLVKLDNTRECFKFPIGRWAGIAILLISLITVSLLIANHLNQTEVEMDLTLSGIGFTAESSQVLCEGFNVERITIEGLKQAILPATIEKSPETIQTGRIEIEALSEGPQRGVLSIGTILLPINVQTTIKKPERLNTCSFRFQHAPVNLIITARGSIELRMDRESRQETYKSPKQLKIIPDSNDITLHATFSDNHLPIVFPLEVNRLSFSSIEQYQPPDQETMTWKQWMIQDGSIFFLDLAGKKKSLRRGEQLQMDEAKGKIESLEFGSNNISLSFKGNVSGLKTGTKDKPIILMPTWLEYLKFNYFIALLWGATAGLCGLLYSIYKWLKG